MRFIQFNVYLNYYLHTFMINYIHYIVSVRTRKITKFVSYLWCVRTFTITYFYVVTSWVTYDALCMVTCICCARFHDSVHLEIAHGHFQDPETAQPSRDCVIARYMHSEGRNIVVAVRDVKR